MSSTAMKTKYIQEGNTINFEITLFEVSSLGSTGADTTVMKYTGKAVPL